MKKELVFIFLFVLSNICLVSAACEEYENVSGGEAITFEENKIDVLFYNGPYNNDYIRLIVNDESIKKNLYVGDEVTSQGIAVRVNGIENNKVNLKACLEEEFIGCTDSDGGKNYYEKGTITGPARCIYDGVTQDCAGGVRTEFDVCVQGKYDIDEYGKNPSLTEFFCGSDGRITVRGYLCASEGKVCERGACVEGVETFTNISDIIGPVILIYEDTSSSFSDLAILNEARSYLTKNNLSYEYLEIEDQEDYEDIDLDDFVSVYVYNGELAILYGYDYPSSLSLIQAGNIKAYLTGLDGISIDCICELRKYDSRVETNLRNYLCDECVGKLDKEDETDEDASCEDSDGGVNYYVKGHLEDLAHGNSIYDDSCTNLKTANLSNGWTPSSKGNILVEYFCGEKNYQGKAYECPNGCEDGACIKGISSIYTQAGTYLVKAGDKIVFPDNWADWTDIYTATIISIDLDPRDDSWYSYAGQPRVYIGGRGVGLVLHEGESGRLLLNPVSGVYVMSFTVNFIDVENGLASVTVIDPNVEKSNETCIPKYECVYEPSVCPSSGVQTKECKDVLCDTKGYEEEVTCNPGNCNGCEKEDGSCIPFGFRLEYEGKNMYCDIDKTLNQQKTADRNGNWALCQNNYECESNVCSSGECVEVASILREAKGLKSVGIKVLCMFAQIFTGQDYNQCIYDYLGEKENTCTDSDEGRDYYVKGEINWGSSHSVDKCYDTHLLTESYCLEGSGALTSYYCPDGCEDGACIKTSKGYLIEEDIGDFEFEELDTYGNNYRLHDCEFFEFEGGMDLLSSDDGCISFQGAYSHPDSKGEFTAFVENHLSPISKEAFYALADFYAERVFDGVYSTDEINSNVVIAMSGDEGLISLWKSGKNLVGVFFENWEDDLSSEDLEEFIAAYLEKYPSDL